MQQNSPESILSSATVNQSPVQQNKNTPILILIFLLGVSITLNVLFLAGILNNPFGGNTDGVITDIESKPTPEAVISPTLEPTSSNEEVKAEIQQFAETYAQAFVDCNWDKFVSLLTEKVKQEAQNTKLCRSDVVDYSILDIVEDSDNSSYIVTIKFTDQNGDSVQNPAGHPKILVLKEDGQWQTMTWYLYQ